MLVNSAEANPVPSDTMMWLSPDADDGIANVALKSPVAFDIRAPSRIVVIGIPAYVIVIPCDGIKWAPVTLTCVPIGPDDVSSEIVGIGIEIEFRLLFSTISN